MKYLFDIDGISYEIELKKGETKQFEYKKGRFAKVSLHKISVQPTTTDIGSAFLRIEFDNGDVWQAKDAVIPRIAITRTEIKAMINRIDGSIKKHLELAGWGNVESKQRLRELRSRKRDLKAQLEQLN